MYYKAKGLDGSRLIEDNSLCCEGLHTATDLNSWHAYLPGYDWEDYLKDQVEKKNAELLREHKYLKDKITNLQSEIKKKSDLEENFNQEIDELNKETQSLVSEIEKWQT